MSNIGTLPQSFRGYIGIAKESSYGGNPAPAYYVDAVSDGFSLDNQPDFQNTTRSRTTHKGEAGPLSDEGSLDLPANPENGLGLLLLAAFGAETFTSSDPDGDGTDEVGQHVFSPADALDSLAVEVGRDTDVVRHAGAGVDALELSHTAEDMLTVSADMIAKEPDPSVTAATPSYSDLRNFRFQDIDLSIAGTDRSPDVQDLTLGIENGLSPEFRGSRTAAKMSVDDRPVTASATLDFESTELFELFLGAAGATSPQDQLATAAIDVTWTTPETIDDTSTNYSLRWNMPTCTINTHEAQINQNDLVAENVEFRALYDTGIGSEAEVTLTNGVVSAY